MPTVRMMLTVTVVMVFSSMALSAIRELAGTDGPPVMAGIAVLALAEGVRWAREGGGR